VQANKKEIKELKTEISKVTSKVEMKTEKIKKYHHHHASEPKKKHSPPTLKPGSPPIFVQPDAVPTQDGEIKLATDQKKGEPITSPKTKPDSPKLKAKTTQSEFPESGYVADTDEPRNLKQATHKYSHFKHEESKMSVEHTSIVSDQVSEQSTQSVQQQQRIEKLLPTKPHPLSKVHHRHSDHKSEKKSVVASATALSESKKVRGVMDLCPSSPNSLLCHKTNFHSTSLMCGFVFVFVCVYVCSSLSVCSVNIEAMIIMVIK
jgi:hypothetical protein